MKDNPMAEESKINVMIIGPDQQRSKGGIATVISSILKDETIKQHVQFKEYPSFIDGSLIKRAVFSLTQEVKFRLQKHNADVYHVHVASGTSFWRKRRYIQSLGQDAAHVILHMHSGRFEKFWNECTHTQRDKVRSLLASVGKVIVVSPEWRDFYITNSICDPEKITILPNAVIIPENNLTDYSINNILFMGRLSEHKSPDVLLKAAAIVLKKHPEAHFSFAGDGDSAMYEQLAQELGISDACSFLGWISGDQKDAAYRSNSIYCLPSKGEGLPMGLLEAMSYGLASIATAVGGIPSVIENGKTGFFIPVGDVDALADAIITLMDNVQLKQRIGEQGRIRIEETCSMEAYSGKLLSIYDEIIGNKPEEYNL